MPDSTDLPPPTEVDPEQERLNAWLQSALERQFRQQYQHGTLLLHQGQAQDALPFLKRAHELCPENVDAALNLGGAYLLTGQHRQAVPVLERAVERAPDNARLWISLGAAWLGNPLLADEDCQLKALAAFRRALKIDPFAPSAAYNIGLIHVDRGEREQAIAAFQRAVQSDAGDLDARRYLRRLEADDT